jgi:hypothetical protein
MSDQPNPRTLLTLASGRLIDLLHPRFSDYADFDWMAEHLAKENRYNGATPGVVYSVAEHLGRGTLAVFETTGDRETAAYFSLHDVHEAVLKDDTTPKKRAIARIADESFGALAAQIMAAFDELTDRHDAAIHQAAGMRYPLAAGMREPVKHYDQVMLITEWRDLMAGAELPSAESYRHIAPLTRVIEPMADWRTAKAFLLQVWREFLPALGGRI